MPIYYTSTGKKITLTTELGRGGEGSVYAVADDSSTVGKIYHQPVTAEKSEKLSWMARHHSPQLIKVAAWTTDTLHERAGGKIVGFLMPAVKAKEIHELYSPKSRRTHFPEADWRFLIHASTNIARAFYNVHEAGHVIGDVNHGNCAVLPDGTVKLIDCDSYSIHANGKTYPCEVGITTHIPPELQGQSLRGVVRRAQHDNFGLAIIIFQLLFLGRHPFSGKPLGKTEKTLEDCIREHRFAYGDGAAAREIQPPPGVPPLQAASAELAKMFERAFLTRDNRPSPREWIEALENLSKNLTICRQNSGHHYAKNLTHCPWCEVEKITGNAVFSPNYRQQAQTGGFNILTIEQLLGAIQMPQNLPPQPARQALTLPPDAQLTNNKQQSGPLLLSLIIAEIALLILLVIYAGGIGAFILGLFFVFIAHRLTNKYDAQTKNDVIAKLSESRQSWAKLEAEWQRRETDQDLLSKIGAAKRKISEYKNLPQLRQQKLKQLQDNLYDRQLDDYLDRFRIDQADIRGIGWNRAVTLQSYGIETAADVDSRRIMSISGFGPSYTQKLVIWREGLKARFRFDPRKGVSHQDTQKVEGEIANARRTLESQLQNETAQIKIKAANINSKNNYLVTEAQKLSQVLAQAESNRAAVSGLTVGIGAMLLLAIGIPIGGGIIKFAVAPPAPLNLPLAAASATPAPSQSSNISDNSNSQLPALAGNNTNLADANINANLAQTSSNTNSAIDSELALLTQPEKEARAAEYFGQGTELTRANNYADAAKLYREAIRYDDTKANYYHELGYALYRLKKNQESVSALQEAIKRGSTSSDTKEILGLNYLELKKWKEAQEIFSAATRASYNSFAAYYNLGIAARNGGDYNASETALKRAVQIKPNDAKAHLELGRCYIKLGRTSDANDQYQILLTQNPKLAEQLRTESSALY